MEVWCKMKKLVTMLLFILIFLVSGSLYAEQKCTEVYGKGLNKISVATGSPGELGLLKVLGEEFSKQENATLCWIKAGTGEALKLLKDKKVDMVMVHAPEAEKKAIKEGWASNRTLIGSNELYIVGPINEPARISEAKDVIEAYRRISNAKAKFVSRGDNSGTHVKELKLWETAGINPKGQKWYLEAGQGMEKTLRIANEKRAYTLSDRGTWLAIRDKQDLAILFEGDPVLYNQYGVMAVNPEKHKHVKYNEAMQFINWIISKEGQAAIASFKDKYGNQLFIPNAK